MRTEIWDATLAINLRGTMIACREPLPHLRATRGCFVNTVSTLALQGHMIQVAYSASKAGTIQMTRTIAASHGHLGVRCNAAAPGMTETPALEAAYPPALRAVVEEETLRGALGLPDDIAQAVTFLASPAAANITGEVLVCDSGTASHVPGLAAFRQFLLAVPRTIADGPSPISCKSAARLPVTWGELVSDKEMLIIMCAAILRAVAAGGAMINLSGLDPTLHVGVAALAKEIEAYGSKSEDPVRVIFPLVGSRWTTVILLTLKIGHWRNAELLRVLGRFNWDEKISQRVLTAKLRALEQEGIVSRTATTDTPPKISYALTPLGISLVGEVERLVQWVHDHRVAIYEARTAFAQHG